MQRYTTMSVFRLSVDWVGAVIWASPCFPSFCEGEDALATAGKMPALHSACNVEQVDHGDDEHPYQVDEVPVQGPDFEVVGLVTAAFVAERNDAQGDHASDYVSQMKAGNCEERRAKQGRPPGVLKQTDAFANECEPFANVEQGKE